MSLWIVGLYVLAGLRPVDYFFNPQSGETNYTYGRDPTGAITLFPKEYRFNPLTGAKLAPLDAATGEAYRKQQGVQEDQLKQAEVLRQRQAQLAAAQAELHRQQAALHEHQEKLSAEPEQLEKHKDTAQAGAFASRGENTSNYAPPTPTQIPVNQSQAYLVDTGEYVVTLKSYERVGPNILFHLQYTNRTQDDLELTVVQAFPEAVMFDDDGNQYHAAAVSFSGGGNHLVVLLPKQVTINADLSFQNLAATARTIAILRVVTWWASPSHPRIPGWNFGQRSEVEFRDIRIS
jgi:hypothetical protein